VIIRPDASAFQVVSPKEHEIPLELMRDVNPFSVTLEYTTNPHHHPNTGRETSSHAVS
jgi:hypothetical protein